MFAYALLLAGAFAAIFVAGGAPQGNLGIFLAVAGAVMIAFPPRARVSGALWVLGLAVVACAAGALLPARLLPTPGWRLALASLPAVPLPATITPAPLVTVFWLALLVLTLLLGLFLLTQPVRSAPMGALMLAASLACAVYAGLGIYAQRTGWHYPFTADATFGFLPNRNHSATLLTVGGLLGVAVAGTAFRDRRWVAAEFALTAVAACVAALFFFVGSRAGVLFFLLGVALWIGGLGRAHRSPWLLTVLGAALLALVGGFFAVKSVTRDRFLHGVGLAPLPPPVFTAQPVADPGPAKPDAGGSLRGAEASSELRAEIYRDTLDLIREMPWTGDGLGTFSGVFPHYRQRSVTPFRALHPESDWLLFMAEAGVPAFACLLALGAALLGRLRGRGLHPFWPLRWGCAAAALAALGHGAVDVPIHRAAVGWLVLVVAGLALQAAPEPASSTRGRGGPRWQRALFALGGVGALLLGGQLIRAEWFGGPALPPFAVEQAPRQIFDATQRKDYARAGELARQTLRLNPLFDQTYFHLGVIAATLSDAEGTDAQVDDYFAAQRRLDPNSTAVPTEQGDTWRGYDPVRVAAMNLDAVARVACSGRTEGRPPDYPFQVFGDFIDLAVGQPEVQRYLLQATRPDGRFAKVWRAHAPADLVREQAAALAADERWMQDPGHAALLRPDWYTRPEAEGYQTPVEGENVWNAAAWPVRLRQQVNAGRYEAAVRDLAGHYGVSLARGGEIGPVPLDYGDPPSPELLRREAARTAAAGDWRAAWLALERYVRHTRQMQWP